MISPRALHLIIQHLDAVDDELTRRLDRKRPWAEPALTSLLADLLDESVQGDYPLKFTIQQLNDALAIGDSDSLVRVTFRCETHEYTPNIERWITQSDLGLIINYDDRLLRQESWSIAWLLQAKRASPALRAERQYTERSGFGGRDPHQHDRMRRLAEIVGDDFVRYLLYCPRPSRLDSETKGKLSYLRARAVNDDIFDYILGLELRDDLLSDCSTLAAGCFLAGTESVPVNLGSVHAGVMTTTLPLSWFFAEHFAQQTHRGPGRARGRWSLGPEHRHTSPGGSGSPGEQWVKDIVSGKAKAIERLIDIIKRDDDVPEGGFEFLPPHTVTVTVSIGADLPGEGLDPQLFAAKR